MSGRYHRDHDTDERLARACIVAEFGPDDVGVLDYLRANPRRPER